MSQPETALEALLTGLIDYAGLYPPASLDMATAVQKYRSHRRGPHAFALGRFIVDLKRLDEFRVADTEGKELKLSVIVSAPTEVAELSRLVEEGMAVEAVECKVNTPADVDQIMRHVPPRVEVFLEIPMQPVQPELLRAIFDCGARAKLRMGGITAEAFSSTAAVAHALEALTRAEVGFKATAGLHHPFRSHHPFTNAADSASGLMHGFINLVSAAALLQGGGSAADAEQVLAEEGPTAFTMTRDSLRWRSCVWSAGELARTREHFVSFGSCSFEEPIRDLEALGWL